MSSNVDVLVKMILDRCREEKVQMGSLGDKLYEMATTTTDQKEDITDEDQLLINKVRELKEAEDAKDLAWINYSSWNALPPGFRILFEELLDPFVWNGIYFKYTKFIEFRTEILRELGDYTVSVTDDGGVKQIYCFDFRSKSFNTSNKSDSMSSKIRDSLVESYGFKNGKIIVKKHSKDENGRPDNTTK